MNTRFYNGKICTMENGPTAFVDELWVRDNRVYYAGPARQADIVFDREINLNGNLLLPGFKNAHTHSGMTFLRSYADDLPLLDWLEKQVFPMEAKLKPQDVYWLSKLAILEYLEGGITANFDMYMPIEPIAKASAECGFRTVLCGGLNDFVSALEELEADYDRFNSYNELVSIQMGFHAEYTCTPQLLEGLSKLLQRRGTPVYVHNSESAREVAECLGRTGKTPTAWMDSFGLFNQGGGCYHCVHMTEEDLAIMKARGMAVVSCPGSNVKLASGIAPLTRMLKMGIPVALGTDGPASNNCLDMFREMFLATGLQKLALNDASALPAETVLEMATVTGARIMGLEDCTSLAAGKLADLMVIDLERPNMQPENSPLKNLVYSGSKSNVKLTMVNGRVLYEDGKFHVGTDATEIYQNANRIIESMRQ